jgi:UDP-glucuronate 4-epimerase
MAPLLFAHAINAGKTIRVFNYGNHQRDFTYVEDIVTGVVAVTSTEPNSGVSELPLPADPVRSHAPFRIYNIGNNEPVKLLDFLATLEHCMGKKARIELAEAQPGDVLDTWADCSALERDYSYRPQTHLAQGIQQFVTWFKDYYGT